MEQLTEAQAVEILFYNYVEESWFDEQWMETDDLAAELIRCARQGWSYIVEKVVADLDYRLSTSFDVYRDDLAASLHKHFADKQNRDELCRAAYLVARKHDLWGKEEKT